MNLLRRTATDRVTKTYGRDSLLIWANPLLALLQSSLGLRIGLRSDAEVLAKMEADVDRMAQRGYRVVASDRHALAVPGGRQGATWYRVTYELQRGPPSAHR